MIGKPKDRIAAALTRTAAQYRLPLTPAQIRLLAGAAAEALALAQQDPDRMPADSPVTANQLGILVMAANGATDLEIAGRTSRSVDTVKTALRRGSLGLGARSRCHASAIAMARGLIRPAQIWIPPGVPVGKSTRKAAT